MRSANLHNNRALQVAFTIAGLCCTALGVLGIFIPLLPTVPFLLLAAACFARGSERFHNRLMEHPQLGPLVRSYLDGQGIPMRAKFVSIGLIWVTVPASAMLFVPLFWAKLILILIALCVSIYLLRLPVRKKEQANNSVTH